jgi:hypothetical protein
MINLTKDPIILYKTPSKAKEQISKYLKNYKILLLIPDAWLLR